MRGEKVKCSPITTGEATVGGRAAAATRLGADYSRPVGLNCVARYGPTTMWCPARHRLGDLFIYFILFIYYYARRQHVTQHHNYKDR